MKTKPTYQLTEYKGTYCVKLRLIFLISWSKKTILEFGNHIIPVRCFAEVISVIIVKDSSKVLKSKTVL